MKQLFVAGLLLLISGGLFFAYITPTYSKIQALQVQNGHLSEALNKSRELQSVRDTLRAKYNTFSPEDLDRLEKLLPDHIDNIRLILDVEAIAAAHNLKVEQFAFSDDTAAKKGGVIPESSREEGFGSLQFQFSVAADYATFRRFMEDLEKSLRVIDITSLTLSPSDSGKYSYAVSIRTYWLH